MVQFVRPKYSDDEKTKLFSLFTLPLTSFFVVCVIISTHKLHMRSSTLKHSPQLSEKKTKASMFSPRKEQEEKSSDHCGQSAMPSELENDSIATNSFAKQREENMTSTTGAPLVSQYPAENLLPPLDTNHTENGSGKFFPFKLEITQDNNITSNTKLIYNSW